jgi:hypothetical protein
MSAAVGSRLDTTAASDGGDRQPVAEVFVVFGISGDVAKVMTFHSLYRRRGQLGCPIVGVAVNDWSVQDPRDHARSAIEACGERIDDEVFDRFGARLSYVSGDFGDNDTSERVASAIGEARTPVFYLEIPPCLFGAVIKGLAGAGLTKTRRVVVEKPFGQHLPLPRPEASDRETEQALRRARIWGWICRLPDGLDTLVGEEGRQLSGGRPQRIVLARALLADAEGLVLDEPTAHLDPGTASELVRDVFSAASDHTLLLITHRSEGLDLVDRVLTLEEGHWPQAKDLGRKEGA